MPYQPQAQSVGFLNIATPDYETKRMRRVAQDIGTQGSSDLASMQAQASGQDREIGRQAGIDARVRQYQLQELSQFSETLNKALQTTVVDFVKKDNERAVAKGVDLQRRAQAGDPKALEELGIVFEDLKAIEDRADELEKQKDALKEEFDKAKWSSTEKAKLFNSKAQELGPRMRYGWMKAELQEAGAGYGFFLQSELAKLGELSGPEKELKIRQLEQQYISNTLLQTPVSTKVAQKYLIPNVTKITDQAIATSHTEAFNRNRQERIDLNEAEFNTILKEGSVADIADSIPKVLDTFRRNHFGQGDANVWARQQLKQQIVLAISQNPDDADKILTGLQSGVLLDHPAVKKGEAKSLTELYPDEFNVLELEALGIAKRNQVHSALDTRKRIEATQVYNEGYEHYLTGASDENGPLYDQALEKLRVMGIEQDNIYALHKRNDLLNVENKFATLEQAEEDWNNMLINGDEILRDSNTVRSWPLEFKQRPEVAATIKDETWADSKTTRAALKSEAEQLNTLITKKHNALTIDRVGNEAGRMVSKSVVDLRQTAEEIHKNGGYEDPITKKFIPVSSKKQAIQKAGSLLRTRIKQEMEGTDETAEYYADSLGFPFARENTPGYLQVKRTTMRHEEYRNNAVNGIRKDKAYLRNTLVIKDPIDLQLDSRGIPSKIVTELSALDPDRTVFELIDDQRRLQDPNYKGTVLDELSESEKVIHSELIKDRDNVRELKQNDAKTTAKVLDRLGTLDITKLTNVMPEPEITDLPKSLSEAGLPSMSRVEYNKNPEVQAKLKRFLVNKAWAKALTLHQGDAGILIKLIAAELSGDSLEDWEAVARGSNYNDLVTNYYAGGF